MFLTGRSGAGKSTLLRLIALMEHASRGEVIVDRRNLQRLPRQDVSYYRWQVGLIFQEHHLLPDKTVFENVSLPLSCCRLSLLGDLEKSPCGAG
ncbi:MAG: cell division transport system ATP-binding protein [Gammaproteobacteria bacterium]